MGSGCFKSRRIAPADDDDDDAAEVSLALQAKLQFVVQLAGTGAGLSDKKIGKVTEALCGADPGDVSNWLLNWLANASAKPRAGLVVLMRRVISQAMCAHILAAEELLAKLEAQDAAEATNFGHIANVCKTVLRLDTQQSQAVLEAVSVIDGAARTSALGPKKTLEFYVVPEFDKLVFLFRQALLSDVNNYASNLLLWYEFEEACGLPPIEAHLSLLTCSAKAVFLTLQMIPDGVPPTTVVVRREQVLLDVSEQLPINHACLLLPYFESSSGTKHVQGLRVEGGEGHGPRKEFFATASSDALRRWAEPKTAPPSNAPHANVGVSCRGNSLSLEPSGPLEEETLEDRQVWHCLAQARAGDKLGFEFTNGTFADRIVTGIQGHGTATIFLNEPLEDGSMPLSSLSRCMLYKPVLSLFEFHRGTGQMWFSTCSSQLSGSSGPMLRRCFRSFGKLLALALANNCKISFTLPLIFFRIILQRNLLLTLADLQGFDDDLHTSLKKILKMKQAQFAALKEVDQLPVGMSRMEYVTEQVNSILLPEAMSEVQSGFWSLVGEDTLRGISASDLRQIVCPTGTLTDDIDIRRIFKVSMEDEMANCPAFVEAFWSVLDGFTSDEKRLFLAFVTGVALPPEPGAERLVIELPFSAFSQEEHEAMLRMLPQAHTCANTLELPNYHDALQESGKVPDDATPEMMATEIKQLLGEKLRLAIKESAGYELDTIGIEEEEDVFMPKPPSPPRTPFEEKRRPPSASRMGSSMRSSLVTASSTSIPAVGEAASLRLTGGLASRGQRLVLPEAVNETGNMNRPESPANPQDGGSFAPPSDAIFFTPKIQAP